jgi:hypothetical protein
MDSNSNCASMNLWWPARILFCWSCSHFRWPHATGHSSNLESWKGGSVAHAPFVAFKRAKSKPCSALQYYASTDKKACMLSICFSNIHLSEKLGPGELWSGDELRPYMCQDCGKTFKEVLTTSYTYRELCNKGAVCQKHPLPKWFYWDHTGPYWGPTGASQIGWTFAGTPLGMWNLVFSQLVGHNWVITGFNFVVSCSWYIAGPSLGHCVSWTSFISEYLGHCWTTRIQLC